MESHRAQVVAKLAELQESLEIIEHKIDIDCGRFAACWSSAPWEGDEDRQRAALPAVVLGDQAAAFDADLAARLGSHSHAGTFTETVSFAYYLARKPAADRPDVQRGLHR